MGPVKITRARAEADTGWCLILVEGSLCSTTQLLMQSIWLRQITNYHSSSSILKTDEGLICVTKWSRIFSVPFSRNVFGLVVFQSLVWLDCECTHWSWGILTVIRKRLWILWQCKGICSFLWCWLSAGQSSRLASSFCFQAGLLGDVCKGSYFGIATLLFWLVQNNPLVRKPAWNKRDFALQ